MAIGHVFEAANAHVALAGAHEEIIGKVRDGIDKTEKSKDWGSNDILMSDVLRRHELQVWFIGEHLVDVPLIED